MWVRATMPYTISFEEAAKFAPQIRKILMDYPMVTEVGSELARPDDGTDPTGFFNCEFYVGLKPYKDATWKKGSIHNKAELTKEIQKRVESYPGVIFNFTQPAEDAVDEALTGLKSALAVKIFGPDLQVLEDKAVEIKRVLQQVPGFTELTVVRELGQPSVQIDVDREKIARYGINVSDVEGVIQAAVGGQAATQVIQGERLFDLVVRMKPEYRSSEHAIGNLLVPTPSGQQVPISELATIHQGNGASFIYRENNSRYIGVQFSIEGRDLARAVNEAQKAVESSVTLPQGYHLDWGGEYSEYVAARQQFALIGPLAVLLIFMILFALYGNFKFPITVLIGVVMTEPVGALLALKLTHTTFSVSSVLGLLVLMGVSAETAIIDVSYINKLRLEGYGIRKATLGWVVDPTAANHDDGAGGLPGSVARSALHRGGIGLPETVCDRDCGGLDLAAVSRPDREPGALPDGGAGGRRAEGVAFRCEVASIATADYPPPSGGRMEDDPRRKITPTTTL